MWALLGTKVLFCCCLLLRQRRRRPPGTRPVRHLSPPWHPPRPALTQPGTRPDRRSPSLAPAPTGNHQAPKCVPHSDPPRPNARLPGTSDAVELGHQAASSLPPRRRRDQTAAAPSALEPTKPAHQSRQQQAYHGGLFPKRRRGRGATTKACFTL